MIEKNLNQCPVCGNDAEIVIWLAKYYIAYRVMCTHCTCATVPYDTEEEAIKAWNKMPKIKKIDVLGENDG